MKPYYQDEWVTQYCGDALDILPQLPDSSIDLLVTDPPYGIGFMGKDWDKALPDKRIWTECLRVLKPGAFAFVMSIPRADCLSRMIISLEDAGFWVNFTPIFWAYASGFPKAQNIGKAVDKRGGVSPLFCEFRDYLAYSIKKSGITLNSINTALGNANSNRISHYLSKTSQQQLPNYETYQILKKAIPLDDTFDEFYREEAEREVIEIEGKQKSAICWGEHYGNRKEVDFTAPSTPQAKALDGSYGGFQPKPAVEVIIVAMKPLSEKTFVDQALKNGKGITWLDDGRIPTESEELTYGGMSKKSIDGVFRDDNWMPKDIDKKTINSRFPANLLVSDDVLNDGRVVKPSYRNGNRDSRLGTFDFGEDDKRKEGYPDSGSFSRYFDLDSWTKKVFGISSIHHESDYLGAVLYNEDENNNAYSDLLYGVSQLFYTLGKSLDWDALCNSFYNDLPPNETLDVRIEKALQDFQGDYLSSFHLDDVRSRLALTTAPNFLQLLDGVHKHNLDCLRKGAWGNRHDYNDHQNWTLSFLLSCLLLPTIIIKVAEKVKLDTSQLSTAAQKTFPFLIVPKASKSEKNRGCEDLKPRKVSRMNTYNGNEELGEAWHPIDDRIGKPRDRFVAEMKNYHPTVKPLKLMSYLITLGSRAGDVVLDPFGGSGTTALASKLLGRHCIISEIEEKYCEIAANRCSQGVFDFREMTTKK